MRGVHPGLSATVGLASALLLVAAPASAQDRDCSAFSKQAAAQSYFIALGGPGSDPDRLNGDGVTCESNRCLCSYSTMPGAPTVPLSPTSSPASVMRVIEGDTVEALLADRRQLTVRRIGIDTPETRWPGVAVKCGGVQASEAMRRLVEGQQVSLVSDPTQDAVDRFGRPLFYVERGSDALDVGEEGLRLGWADVFVFDQVYQHLTRYRTAERGARNDGAGVGARCEGDFHRSRADQLRERRLTAAAFMRRYYRSISRRRFLTAWRMLGPGLRRKLGPYRQWKAGYRQSLGTSLRSAHARLSRGRAMVAVSLRTRHRDACSGRIVRQYFGGRWILAPRRDDWMAVRLRMRKTGGGRVRLFKSECGAEQPPPSPPPSPRDCQAYDPCLPPEVSVTAPSPGATVSGTVTLAASATDNVGVTRVTWSVDGREVTSDTRAPWSQTWDSATVADGGHSVVATAQDGAGHVRTSAAVSFAVLNSGGGTPTGDPVIAAAGDIADSGSGDDATARLLDALAPTAVLTTGDNAYYNGTLAEFNTYYDPTWGRHRAITHPVPGNHEYHTAGAAGYFYYFGAAAGDRARGYYSFNLGAWHLIALNSEVPHDAASAQVAWLKSDLAGSAAKCTLAYWHKPRFTAGRYSDFTEYTPFWQALWEANADVVLAGHDHNYQRYGPLNPSGVADSARGIREFVVGTGGRSLNALRSDIRRVAGTASAYGVLKLTLHPASFDFSFVPEAGQTYSDSGGEIGCH